MISDRIKELMKIKKITSKELANSVGVSTTHISYVLNNKRDPSIELLNKIANVLNVSVNDFFDSSSINKNDKEKEYEDLISKECFDTPEEAMKFILMQPSIMGFGGFDVTKMNKSW